MRFLVPLLATALLAAPPSASVKSIAVPLRVAAPAGDSASTITAADLSAKLEGNAAKVGRVLGPQDPLLLLIVTDMVGDLSVVTPAKQALIAGIQALPPEVRAGLMRAQDGLNVVVDPTADRDALAEAIDSLAVTGKAAFLNTIETMARIGDGILMKSAVRVAILYLTDSAIQNYREDYTNPVINQSDSRDMSRRFPEGLVREKIARLDMSLSRLQAPIFIVHLDYRTDTLNEAYQVGLKQVAQTTGGTSVFCRSNAEIPDAIKEMFGTIRSLYRVDVQLPERHPKIVKLEMESGKRVLTYRSQFRLDGK